MAAPRTTGTARTTDRLEAFSDAVLAIAITLPVVNLSEPDLAGSADLAAAYAELAPDYAAYALSVVVIGLYWARSHFSGKVIEKTDHGFNLLTVLFLALVSVTPLPARPLLEHLTGAPGDANTRIAAVVYAWVLAAPGVTWVVRWGYAARRGLVDARLAPAYVRRLTRAYVLSAAALVTGAAVATLLDWRVGLGLAAAVTLGYGAPPAAPEYRPGQAPESELEDAGDAAA